MISTLKALSSTLGKLQIGSQIKPQTVSALVSKHESQFLQNEVNSQKINLDVPCRGRRLKFQGFRRNWPEFYHYIRERRIENPLAFLIKKNRDPKMRGNIAVYDLEGKRTHLQSALDRFKRLDGTGSYINSVVGRSNKAHQKSERHKWHSEQHVFCWFRFDRKLDRMFLAHQKRKRYFVDDPYEKYHKMSFLKYQESLKKNAKNIQEHGNRQYKFNRYRMHMDYLGPLNHIPDEQYAPPGFQKTIADNAGVYKPEGDNKHTEPEWMAPHFQRVKIQQPDFVIRQKYFKITPFRLDEKHHQIRQAERFYGRLKPWNRVMHLGRY